MPALLLKFYIYLRRQDVMRNFEGPLFHRWLPDGEKDAIFLNTGVSKTELKVWFERRGFVNDGIIEFDVTRKEVDSAIIPTQAALVVGSLFGSLELQELTKEEITSLLENKIGEPDYKALGERVVNMLIYPSVSRFINTLRTKYGQYWIHELREWNSRHETLGAYCIFIRLKWSLDQGATWFDFIPDDPIRRTIVTFGTEESFRQYLTEEDWKGLAQLSREKYEPSLASSILTRAHQFFDEEDFKYALIEGVTALELSLKYYIRFNLKTSTPLPILENMRLEDQLKAVAPSLSIPNRSQKMKLTLQAIKIRNKSVHEILLPSERVKPKIAALLDIAAALNFGLKFKLPSARLGNKIMPVENWEQQS